MARKHQTKKAVNEVLARLDEHYPEVECALTHDSAYQLVAAVSLSAQCTDKMVNTVTPALFERYPTPQDLAAADIDELEKLIFKTGFYRNKAKNLKGMGERVANEFGGEIPDNFDDLMTLPGVARKTANVIMNVWYKKASGVVVDTHVKRISGLLGWSSAKSPDAVSKELEALIPEDHWIPVSLQMIELGRNICIARRPQCSECFLNDLCPSAQV